ncbi:MAG: HEPN domain-containing protein [Mesorhizobium sp.]|uniref:nucleotidyltransferase and HEPN domain-containing protein n=1 Tax=Mesorhizobium sp. TaxID=1871066 RepID=UPI000FE8F1AC|nr:nucleotidyltransferase and HEPN domain-containing protein [Mesorhizobium sp.]RWM18270.1 MAG: HEPN domain-containing protein [Mesorhizobium sp.]TIP74898.1 MAG: HEPN domain-containing protein [Mesorhizobium sp.]TIQ12564.1 MAG: HEPN domain-containing protein [Mesorhizobium sp.]TIR51771.1 MAG: HEPN domain-containing protein [Mesorhizobium sp.]TJV96390.1 MAG: HEPN domain-containing protein [Mesorhizobium sp.]
MRTSIDHLPFDKQRELARVVEILHEEFEDALKGSSAEFKKKGRILKIILFGSYARGDWVDEPHTMKGYRSDFDLLVVVNNRKLTDFATYWYKASDRLLRDRGVSTQVGLIVHSRREVNTALRQGQYFFSDIRRQGIALYELDDEPLSEPKPQSSADALKSARKHFQNRFPGAAGLLDTSKYALAKGRNNEAAFLLHQAVEHAYSALLLTVTSYSPPSHNLNFLRTLAEERDRRMTEAWPRDQQRFRAWFNALNEAYVKARYSEHYQISVEALEWLGSQTSIMHSLVETICREHLEKLAGQVQVA